ncbi:putative periplasmic protein [Halobacteriovorax marinus SJ]|uniref:Periplasmic protein n=1 Tax=Halobacteriovorax marinus (strain ATCC BAA-682 / DSM 15412 / SJ) TaxID=862908 RepID=E1X5E4_HALMS|nr:YceI family protein [Halobacteriovorax marinus]CBW27265.1 putative periplasmic protein [Halobacteriovorax marinus SJ]
MKFILSLFLFTSIAQAACFKDATIGWSAYKTPAKAAVGGTFKGVSFTSNKSEDIKEILTGATFNLDASTVFTKDKGRDAKIAKFFFSTLEGGSKITGVVKKVSGKVITVAITMNAKTVDVPLSYDYKNGKLSAKGVVDVFDFAMSDELSALNKACAALHQGKTWNDVAVNLEANFGKCN